MARGSAPHPLRVKWESGIGQRWPLPGRPAQCVEDSHRVEVVAPVDYLAVAEGEHRDVAAAVRASVATTLPAEAYSRITVP